MSIKIIPVLCNEKNMNNYAYFIVNEQNKETIIIDAAEARPIINKLEELSLIPTHILTTHHHFDHVEGNLELKELYNLTIVAPELEFNKVPGADIKAIDGETLKIGNFVFDIILAKGHTNGHVLYHLKDENALFTGDMLFNLCVGGLFEGTPQQMFESLAKIKLLDDDTNIFPGHEYTRSCIPQDYHMCTNFEAYIHKMIKREQGLFAPSTLKEEKEFNPYLKARSITDL